MKLVLGKLRLEQPATVGVQPAESVVKSPQALRYALERGELAPSGRTSSIVQTEP